MCDCIFISLLQSRMGLISRTSGSLWLSAWALPTKTAVFLVPKVNLLPRYRAPSISRYSPLVRWRWDVTMAGWSPEKCSYSSLHHSPWRSVQPEGAPNDDAHRVVMTDLGWLPPLFPFGASASSAAHWALLSTVSPETRHVCPGIQRQAEMLNMHTSCWAGWFPLCSCSPFLPPPSVSLYLLHLLHPILSQSLSINKSFLAGCSRLNQPLCKHGC